MRQFKGKMQSLLKGHAGQGIKSPLQKTCVSK